MMNKKDVIKIIDDLAESFSKDSVGAIDHGVNARAIALQDVKFRSYLAENFERGRTLVRVSPNSGYGSQTDNFVVVFEFREPSTGEIVDLGTVFCRVTVNLPGRAVSKFEETENSPFDFENVPFAVAVPSKAGEAVTLGDVLARVREKERDFMRGLGLIDLVRSRDGNGWLLSANNTFVDTSTGTTSTTSYETSINSGYSPDVVGDVRQDPGGDTDNKIDGSNDPERDGLVALPTDRAVLVLPRPRPGTDPRPTPEVKPT